MLCHLSNLNYYVLAAASIRAQQTQAAPDKFEVFVDDQKILVDPGTTVLQVDV